MGRREYFDQVSDHWDGWNRQEVMIPKLRSGLLSFGVQPSEHVLDLGCGTGMLLTVLLEHLDPDGSVIAVDFSPKMLEIARKKFLDRPVTPAVRTVL